MLNALLLMCFECPSSAAVFALVYQRASFCAQNIVAVHASVSFSETVVTVPTDGQASVTATITQPTGFGVQGAMHCVFGPHLPEQRC